MLLDDIPQVKEGDFLEEVLLHTKQVVIGCPEKLENARFLVRWSGGVGFKGVASIPLEGGAVNPVYFSSCADIPLGSFLVLTEDERGYTLLATLSRENIHVSMQGDAAGVVLEIAGRPPSSAPLLVVVRGDNLRQVVAEGMAQALTLTGGYGHAMEEKLPPPKWFELLGWESGHSLGTFVSHRELVVAIERLKESGVTPAYVLIEEGWQEAEKSALAGFDADLSRFPEGLKGVVRDLHRLGVKHVGVSHSIMGGSEGVAERIAQRYNFSRGGNGRYFFGGELKSAFQFYHDYYAYLREQGVAFTKVLDEEDVVLFCRNGEDPFILRKNLQAAIQAAGSVQFDSFHFNANSLGNGTVFYWANSRVCAVADRMDELSPLGPMRTIRNSLVNSLWLQHLMQPDFGPWATRATYSEMLAIFHALSGSLIMISDGNGVDDKALLEKVMLPSGRLLITDRFLTLCPESVFFDPIHVRRIYKAFTRKGDCGLLGVFNLCEGKRSLHGTASSDDIEDLHGEEFAVYSCQHGFLGKFKAGEAIAVTLKPGQADILTFSPLKYGVAVFGCFRYFLAPATLVDVDVEEESVHVTMSVAGPLLLYSERKVLEVRRNGTTVPWEWDAKVKTLSIDSRAPISEAHATYTVLFEA